MTTKMLSLQSNLSHSSKIKKLLKNIKTFLRLPKKINLSV